MYWKQFLVFIGVASLLLLGLDFICGQGHGDKYPLRKDTIRVIDSVVVDSTCDSVSNFTSSLYESN